MQRIEGKEIGTEIVIRQHEQRIQREEERIKQLGH